MIKRPTQLERLADYLADGKRVNPLTAWSVLGIYRLSARINEISKEIKVKRQLIDVVNRHGEKVKVMEYWF